MCNYKALHHFAPHSSTVAVTVVLVLFARRFFKFVDVRSPINHRRRRITYIVCNAYISLYCIVFDSFISRIYDRSIMSGYYVLVRGAVTDMHIATVATIDSSLLSFDVYITSAIAIISRLQLQAVIYVTCSSFGVKQFGSRIAGPWPSVVLRGSPWFSVAISAQCIAIYTYACMHVHACVYVCIYLCRTRWTREGSSDGPMRREFSFSLYSVNDGGLNGEDNEYTGKAIALAEVGTHARYLVENLPSFGRVRR